MNTNHNIINRKFHKGNHKAAVSTTTYDQSMGIIRIMDHSFSSNTAPSLSPIKLNRAMRRNIKKPAIAKNVECC